MVGYTALCPLTGITSGSTMSDEELCVQPVSATPFGPFPDSIDQSTSSAISGAEQNATIDSPGPDLSAQNPF
jgi:hypothetical protein